MEGYAAFSTPYELIRTHLYDVDRGETLRSARAALARRQWHTLRLCASKRRRLAEVEREACGQPPIPLGPSHTWCAGEEGSLRGPPRRGFFTGLLLSAWASIRGVRDDGTRSAAASRVRRHPRITEEAGDLRGLIAGFHQHSLFLFLRAAAVDGILQATEHGQTASGRFWAFSGVVLGLYAATKLSLTVIRVGCATLSTQDPLTQVVDLLRWLHIPSPPPLFDVGVREGGAVSPLGVEGFFHTRTLQLFAVLVNGWMILSSVRGLLLIVFRLTMTFRSVTADTTAVVFAGLIGVYFLGQLVLLLPLPPPETSLSVTGDAVSALTDGGVGLALALEPFPMDFYQRLNDWCFVLSFMVTLFVQRYVLGDPAATTVSVAHG
ncbi:unnamed protein product, partial [Phytomonas sp. EM1]